MRRRTWLSVVGGGIALFWGFLNFIGNIDTISALFSLGNPHWFIRLLAVVTLAPVVTPILLCMAIILFLVAISTALSVSAPLLRTEAEPRGKNAEDVENAVAGAGAATRPVHRDERVFLHVTPEEISALFNDQNYTAYEAQGIFEKRYKYRWLRIQRAVTDVDDYRDQTWSVSLFGKPEESGVRCEFSAAAVTEVTSLRKGDIVEIEGCVMKGATRMIVLEESRIVSVQAVKRS